MGRPQVLLQKCSVLRPTQLLERVQRYFAYRPARPGLPKVFASRASELPKQIVTPVIETLENAYLRHQVGDGDLAASRCGHEPSLEFKNLLQRVHELGAGPGYAHRSNATSSMQVRHGNQYAQTRSVSGAASTTRGKPVWDHTSMDSWASSPRVRRSMQSNRPRNTAPEVALRSALHRAGLRFFKHRQPVPGLRCEADIIFPGPRVAGFVDGCFWHGCPPHPTFPKTHPDWC